MALSLAQRFALLPRHLREQWIDAQEPWVLEEIARGEWWWHARPEQIPPEDSQLINLFLAGRGAGKTRSGAEWIVDRSVKHPVDRHGAPTERLIIAETLGDARTVCLEGPAGVLRVLDRREIPYRYKQSPRPTVIFEATGAKIHCFGADSPNVARGLNAADAWLDEVCIARGELVVTIRGRIPVEDVVIGDLVMTRDGWRPVVSAGLTRRNAEVLNIRTDAGGVRVTPEHRVWATGRGWVEARNLQIGDTMVSWTNTKTPSQPQSQPTCSGMALPGITISEPGTTTTAVACCYTGPSGHECTAPSPMAMRSTTSTGAAGTTGSQTWNCSPSPTIVGSPPSSVTTPPGLRAALSAPAGGSRNSGHDGSHGTSCATCAARPTRAPGCVRSGALPSARPKPLGDMAPTIVRSVDKVAEPTDVYDLTVAGEPEFFAGSGSLLVHNCKWLYAYESWYEGIMPSLRADLPEDHPRAFVTTTPKPMKLLQEWLAREDDSIHIIRGSTFDNASNLNQYALDELRRRYEGTAIGRQELYGEMLEALDGALFKRSDIEATRVAEPPEDPVSIVVGVDPSLVGDADEMGVVVVARTRDNHLYVLADSSIQAAGRDAALHVWKTVIAYNADIVIYEENLGKKWMEQVFTDAWGELVRSGALPVGSTPPMRGIDAKLGKKTRAEPVAMRCEQRTIHFVGNTFQALEDQLTTFTSWDGKESPNRLDAFVHACRHHMLAERNRGRIIDPDQVDKQRPSRWDDGLGAGFDFRW